MLAILLCIFFPPAIPFVIIWRMGRGRRTQKQQLSATRDLIAITAVPVAMRGIVLEQRAASRSMARMFKLIVAISVVVLIAIAVGGTHP